MFCFISSILAFNSGFLAAFSIAGTRTYGYNGDGIPAEILPKIFDPFFTTKEEGKGVGLGLAVVYGIVDAHGGEIDVKSTMGEGTTFTVRLPLSGSMPQGGTRQATGAAGSRG